MDFAHYVRAEIMGIVRGGTRMKKNHWHGEHLISSLVMCGVFFLILLCNVMTIYLVDDYAYMYSFADRTRIDNVLDIFMKLPESKAPLDYIICVQIIGQDNRREIEQLKTLIELKTLNKISTFADTVYRYSYNEISRYEAIQAGVFQHKDSFFELHEFVKKV
jgi:hypothetical protein